jgi:Tfp pilus assembly protein PilF
MLTHAAMPYREMALINIAFCYSQLGNVGQAKAYYQRTLQEFPTSSMARTALNTYEAMERHIRDEANRANQA